MQLIITLCICPIYKKYIYKNFPTNSTKLPCVKLTYSFFFIYKNEAKVKN